MTARLRLSFACAGLVFWAAASLAADDAEVVIATKLDDKKLPVSVTDLDVRPNTKQPFYIFVKNISAVPAELCRRARRRRGLARTVSQRIAVAVGASRRSNSSRSRRPRRTNRRGHPPTPRKKPTKRSRPSRQPACR